MDFRKVTRNRKIFDDLLKYMKNEIVYSTDQVNPHNEEEDVDTSVISDEEDSKVDVVVDSIRHRYSSLALCHNNNTSCSGVKHTAPNPQILLNFEELSKSPKMEFCDSRFEEKEEVEDKKHIKIADLMDSTTTIDPTEIGNRDSIPKLCYSEAKTSPSNSKLPLDIRNNFEELLKSPKKEFPDSSDQDESGNGEVDLDMSVNDDDEDVKVFDRVDKTTKVAVTSNSERDTVPMCPNMFTSTGSFSGETQRAMRRSKLIEERKYKQEKSLKNLTNLITKSKTNNNTSSSAETEIPAVNNKPSTKRYEFICDKCNIKFESKKYLERHVSKCDGSKNCTMLLYRKSGPGTLVKNPYACNLCNYRSSQLALIKNHVLCHTGEKPHACNICDRKFRQLGLLQRHIRVHTGEKPYVCSVCGYQCSQSRFLKLHMTTHTGEKPHVCNVCGLKCSQTSDLKRHIRTHTGEKPYVCNICGCKFPRTTNLKLHMGTHTGEKPYVCNICGCKFSRSGNLKRHMQIHTGEKHHVCNICGNQFFRSSHLKKHMTTHTGEKAQACNICNRKFRQIGPLKRHISAHTQEKPHVCKICGWKCSESRDMKRHVRKHTEKKSHICNVCGFKTSYSLHLIHHIRTHTGEKPYICNVCGYQFSQSSNLKQHMKTHTGEKPHACNICSCKFLRSSNLKRHIQTHKGSVANIIKP